MHASHIYCAVSAEAEFASLAFPKAPFAALIIDPKIQTPDTQFKLCHALIDAGCQQLAAWGADSTQWDDSGDYAAILTREGALREPAFDMLTWWHADDPLQETVAFCLTMQGTNPTLTGPILILEFGTQFGAPKLDAIFAAALAG